MSRFVFLSRVTKQTLNQSTFSVKQTAGDGKNEVNKMFKNKINFLLTIVFFGAVFFQAAQTFGQTCTPPPSGLVAWLPGDGNAQDITGNGNNGILEGNVTFPAGKVAQAFGLDGTTTDVKIPASQTLNVGLSNGLTIDAWINPRDVSTEQPLVEWNNGSNYEAHFWISVS